MLAAGLRSHREEGHPGGEVVLAACCGACSKHGRLQHALLPRVPREPLPHRGQSLGRLCDARCLLVPGPGAAAGDGGGGLEPRPGPRHILRPRPLWRPAGRAGRLQQRVHRLPALPGVAALPRGLCPGVGFGKHGQASSGTRPAPALACHSASSSLSRTVDGPLASSPRVPSYSQLHHSSCACFCVRVHPGAWRPSRRFLHA
mmetsp:Transcript_86186/g.261608  ORF Transcript_86186/g.261608 Transcript_86186/m.261608 type:complete len:202 (-) Transcript_86186:8-613(-)